MAQLGRALRSGRRGRGFESRRFDSWQGQSRNCMNMRFRDFSFSKTRRLQSAAPEGYPPHKAEDVLSWYWTERYKPETTAFIMCLNKISKRKSRSQTLIRKDPYFARKSFTAQEENRRKSRGIVLGRFLHQAVLLPWSSKQLLRSTTSP